MKKKRAFVQERKALNELLPLTEPLAVVIEMGDTCNFKCRFCYNSEKESIETPGEEHFISLDLYKKIISDLNDFNGYIDTLRITGDIEPLQHPKFVEFIKLAKASDKVKCIKMSTNASLLTPELSHDIISSGMDIIQISINGVNDAHYKYITNCDVSFNLIKENVEYLYSIKENAHIHIKCIGDFFSKVQQKEFLKIFSPISDSINIEWMANQWLGMELETKNGKNRFDLNDVKKSEICSRPFYMLTIHPNGNVNCCPSTNMEPFSIANINTSSLYDIWNGNELYELRLAFLRGDYKSIYNNCSICKFSEFQSSEDLTEYRDILLEKYGAGK